MAEGISFGQLLAANEEEAERWRGWFERQPPEILDLPTQIAQSGTLRRLALHIQIVELFFSEKLNGLAPSDYEALPVDSVASLFAIGERARSNYRAFLAHATEEELSAVVEFSRTGKRLIRASKRKMFVHAMFHSMRHWAQVAVLLRESGHATDWLRDFILSDVMD